LSIDDGQFHNFEPGSMEASSNPFRRGSWGWVVFINQNHGAGGGNGSILVGMFVCLCLASQYPFELEFFVPARMDLGVKLTSSRRTSWAFFAGIKKLNFLLPSQRTETPHA